MRPPVPRTLFLDASIGSYPWCGGHSGNATSPHPYEHGRLARDETPISSICRSKNIKLLMNFIIIYFTLPILYIEGGSVLLKSRDGGISLNISIKKKYTHNLNDNKQRELY